MKKAKKILVVVLLVVLIVTAVLLTSCKEKNPALAYFEDTRVYKITKFDALGFGPVIALALDFDQSYFSFDEKGTCEFRIMINKHIIPAANVFISTLIGSVKRESIDKFNEAYTATLFPGFTFDEVIESFRLLRKGLGLEVIGLEEDSEIMKKVNESFAKGEAFPEDIKLPEIIGIKYTGPYFLMDVKSPSDGTVYHGLFLGKYVKNTQPYVGATLESNVEREVIENGTTNKVSVNTLSITVDFLKLNIIADMKIA